MKRQSSIWITIATLALAAGLPALRAAEPAPNPTGTWKMLRSSTNSQTAGPLQTLTLKLDGGKLTGTLTYNSSPIVNGKVRVSEKPITEAKIQGDEISFHFTHPPSAGNGPNPTYDYQGKLSGDTIKGTCTMEWMGNTRTRDWAATRVHAATQ
jgi:hypothetical protein